MINTYAVVNRAGFHKAENPVSFVGDLKACLAFRMSKDSELYRVIAVSADTQVGDSLPGDWTASQTELLATNGYYWGIQLASVSHVVYGQPTQESQKRLGYYLTAEPKRFETRKAASEWLKAHTKSVSAEGLKPLFEVVKMEQKFI
jgi:hypothetical protein